MPPSAGFGTHRRATRILFWALPWGVFRGFQLNWINPRLNQQRRRTLGGYVLDQWRGRIGSHVPHGPSILRGMSVRNGSCAFSGRVSWLERVPPQFGQRQRIFAGTGRAWVGRGNWWAGWRKPWPVAKRMLSTPMSPAGETKEGIVAILPKPRHGQDGKNGEINVEKTPNKTIPFLKAMCPGNVGRNIDFKRMRSGGRRAGNDRQRGQ